MQRTVIALSLAALMTGAAATVAQPTVTHVVLTASDAAPGDAFGRSVAISGDTIVVGAPGDDERGEDAGAAYVFVRDVAGSWTQRQKLLPAELLAGDRFGWSVAIDGDVAVVGAPGDDRGADSTSNSATADRGAAYVFRRTVGGWVAEVRLQPLDLAAADAFGWSVATTAGTVFVGAPGRDSRQMAVSGYVPAPDAGEVRAFALPVPQDDGSLGQAMAPYNTEVTPGAFFGFSLWGAGGLLSVAAPYATTGSSIGRTFLYEREGETWVGWYRDRYSSGWTWSREGAGIEARFLGLTDIVRAPDGVLVVEVVAPTQYPFYSYRFSRVDSSGHVTETSEHPPTPSIYLPLNAMAASGPWGWSTDGRRAYSFAGTAGHPDPFSQGPPSMVDGVGDAARFFALKAIDLDPATGDAYVVDACAVRRITTSLDVTTIAGGTTCGEHVDAVGAAARFVGPTDLAVADGIAFVTDATTVRRVVLATGEVTTWAGAPGISAHVDGPPAAARFRSLRAVAYGSGALYLSDATTIRRASLAGEVSTLAGDPAGIVTISSLPVDGTGQDARLVPGRLVEAAPGRIVFLENECVREVTDAGVVRTLAGLPRNSQQSGRPYSIAHAAYTVAAGRPLGTAPFSSSRTGLVTTAPLGGDHLEVAWPTAADHADGYGVATAVTTWGALVIGPANGCVWTSPHFCEPLTPADGDVEPVALLWQPRGTVWQDWLSLPAPDADVRSGYGSALAVQDLTLVVGAPELDERPQAPASGRVAGAGRVFVYDLASLDGDFDGLPDVWEIQMRLDPTSGAGDEGAAGDPDGDGLTNAQEHAARSHPRGDPAFARYFAEGASGFFDTEFAIANPGGSAATVSLRFMRADGSLARHTVTVPPLQLRRVLGSQVLGPTPAEFSTEVESDATVVVDRVMRWDRTAPYGSHGDHGVAAPSTTWYLAEGATHSGFDLFYLLQNPGDVDTTVLVRYLRPGGQPLEKTYRVGAHSRLNVWVNLEEFPEASGNRPLAASDVSAVVTSLDAVPIVVERAMYLTRAGARPFEAGHEASGVTAPALAWLFAEGATGSFFDLFFLIANPSDSTAQVRATYLLEDGRTFEKVHAIAPGSRFTIWVDREQFEGSDGLPLADVAVSTTFDVLNGVGVVVERAMWWPGDHSAWYEAHVSPGSSVAATRWAMAAGSKVETPRTDTYLLIANPGPSAARVVLTPLFDDGTPTWWWPPPVDFVVVPHSRLNVDMRPFGWGTEGKPFGVLVESRGDAPVPIVVEWAIYSDAPGQRWAAGANALATVVK